VLTFVSAGHQSPLLYQPGNPTLTEVVEREVSGPPLGIMEDLPFGQCEITLKPGENLLLYTDGVTDSLNPDNNQFNISGIEVAIQSAGVVTPRVFVERVFNAVHKHAAGRPAFDDITLLSIGRTS
jgi:sigma-B regulation protein RsbU (phosphoserine phosphatase)